MSSWTILTLRGKRGTDYEHARYDEPDRWDATADIAATVDECRRVRQWTAWNDHVYAYLAIDDLEEAEEYLEQYAEMADDAVLLRSNNTVDLGTARYYPDADGYWTDCYHETEGEDGYFTGELALATINARHRIHARDPFHNNAGTLDDTYLEDGTNRGDSA